jgi:hypothetical protein
MTTLQTQLFEAVAQLQEILDLQDAKQKITREIRSKDSSILAFANKLKEAEHVLDVLVDDYSNFRRHKRLKPGEEDDNNDSCTTTVSTRLNLSDILSYAHRISYTTFAPPEFGAGTAPLRGALPPAPQEEQLRASQLYNFADLDIGLPKIESEEKMIEPIMDPMSGANPLPGLLPPNIVVPSGWKPGMPVELPTDLPLLPPPGWKHGDPIALPPLDTLPAHHPRAMEQQQQRPVPLTGFPRAPEPIHVPHVDLDIPDNDDSSDDYSSDSASYDNDED